MVRVRMTLLGERATTPNSMNISVWEEKARGRRRKGSSLSLSWGVSPAKAKDFERGKQIKSGRGGGEYTKTRKTGRSGGGGCTRLLNNTMEEKVSGCKYTPALTAKLGENTMEREGTVTLSQVPVAYGGGGGKNEKTWRSNNGIPDRNWKDG